MLDEKHEKKIDSRVYDVRACDMCACVMRVRACMCGVNIADRVAEM